MKVTYEGIEFEVTREQHTELQRLAFDDPPACRAMAFDLIQEQTHFHGPGCDPVTGVCDTRGS